MTRTMTWLFLMSILLLPAPSAAAAPLSVMVTIEPQAWFVRALGGKHVTVRCLVPAGENPETYRPTPDQVAEMSRTDIYFHIGATFEAAWLERFKALNPRLVLCRCDRGMAPFASPQAPAGPSSPESAAPGAPSWEAEHMHDPESAMPPAVTGGQRLWLSPLRAATIADNILHTLVFADPSHSVDYHTAHDLLRKRLESLHARLEDMLHDLPKNATILTQNAAWECFARDYGLKAIVLPGQADTQDSDRAQRIVREKGIATLFVQPELPQEDIRRRANALGLQTKPADALAPDWDENLLRVAREFAREAR